MGLQIGATLQKDVPYNIYIIIIINNNNRYTLSQLTIVDSFLLKNEWVEIGQEAIERFERTYQHLRDEMPFLFVDYVI